MHIVYSETAHPGPKLSFQAHTTQVYSLAFAGDAAEPLLIRYGTAPAHQPFCIHSIEMVAFVYLLAVVSSCI